MHNVQNKIIELAKQASQQSFCPMSGFSVGAAILLKGENQSENYFVQGINYETQNYRSVCAEKHALQNAQLQYKNLKAYQIAIYSPNSPEPIMPCGDCRQALFDNNPDLEILAIGSNNEVKTFTAKELLPFAFSLNSKTTSSEEAPAPIDLKQKDLLNYIVHFPVLEHRLQYLQNMQALIIVGSPVRAAKMAMDLGADCLVEEYCHLQSGNTDREYSLFSLSWSDLPYKVGIASHGIGSSGIEIVLAELNALITLANNTNEKSLPLKAIIRSGTRGTLDDIPLGSLALTNLAFDDNFNSNLPSEELVEYLKTAAQNLNLNLYEGACLSSQFFWSKQGRSAYPLTLSADGFNELEKNNNEYLFSLKQKNIKYLEMEDYYLNSFAQKYGCQSASVGIVLARRYEQNLNKFILSYDKNIKKENELIPGKLALLALKQYLSVN